MGGGADLNSRDMAIIVEKGKISGRFSPMDYRHISFYCALVYDTSHILCFVYIEIQDFSGRGTCRYGGNSKRTKNQK